MWKFFGVLVLIVVAIGCSKDNIGTEVVYSGQWITYSRSGSISGLVEKRDTFLSEVLVRRENDSIFFSCSEVRGNGAFLVDKSGFYKNGTSMRPYHAFTIVDDSLLIEFSYAAPIGPDNANYKFRGVKK